MAFNNGLSYYLTIALLLISSWINLLECRVATFSIDDIMATMDSTGRLMVGRIDVSKELHLVSPSDDQYNIMSILKEVREIGADGSTVVKSYDLTSENSTHNFEFNTTEPMEYHGLGVVGRSMDSMDSMDQAVGLEVIFSAYLFGEDGTVTFADETDSHSVSRGDARLEWELSDKDICDGCQIEIVFWFVASGVGTMTSEDAGTKVDKDGGVAILIPSTITVDGVKQDTGEENPQVRSLGDKVEVTLRVPKFEKTATYGAFITPSSPPEKESSEEGGEEEEKAMALNTTDTRPVVVDIKDEGDNSTDSDQNSSNNDDSASSSINSQTLYVLFSSMVLCLL